MTLPVVEAYNILTTEETTKGIDWYTIEIPEQNRTIPSLPVGRITNINDELTFYASNEPHYTVGYIQVDVWLTNLQGVNDVYQEMDRLMRKHGFKLDYSEFYHDRELTSSIRIIKRYHIINKLEVK